MILYFDGASYGHIKDTNETLLTYGVLLHNKDNEPIEAYGQHAVTHVNKMKHEYIAFLESFKLLKKNGLDYRKVSFYTDSEEIANAQLLLHSENNMVLKKEKFLITLKHAVKFLKMSKDMDEIIDCLSNSRFVKVKSHNQTVDNIRVDHLTRSAYKKTKPKKYKDFLKCISVSGVGLPFVHNKENNILKMKI
jgi:ribonuclease HI